MNKIRIFLCLFFLLPLSAFSAERLEWSSDESVLEYKVELKNRKTGEVKSYTTQNNYIDIFENDGEYEFRVKPVDMLGREGDFSSWQSFKITKAMTPVLATMPPAAWKIPEASADLVTLPVDIQNVSARTKVQLVNQETKQVVDGSLVIQSKNGLSKANGIKVPPLPGGAWKLVVTDASGRSAESGIIKVENLKEEKQKKEALAKAEAEAKAAEAQAAREAELAAAENVALADAGGLAGVDSAAGADAGLAEDILEQGVKKTASSAQKIRIEKQIAKKVREFQRKGR
ncbi:MAG: hypothetical protein IJR80_08265 [Treponema sp.]|nr:hypothetical protein [Treponema sp.]